MSSEKAAPEAEDVEHHGSDTSLADSESATEAPPTTEEAASQPDSATDPMSLEVERLKQELEAERARARDFQDQMLRVAADFDNYRKRMQRDQARQSEIAQEQTIKQLLPIVDNLERAVAHIQTATRIEGIREGQEAILRQCLDILAALGVVPMQASGVPFDPNLHDALTQQTSSDHPEGTVLQSVQTGYMIRDRVLRHAKVVVSKAPPTEEHHVPGGSPTPN